MLISDSSFSVPAVLKKDYATGYTQLLRSFPFYCHREDLKTGLRIWPLIHLSVNSPKASFLCLLSSCAHWSFSVTMKTAKWALSTFTGGLFYYELPQNDTFRLKRYTERSIPNLFVLPSLDVDPAYPLGKHCCRVIHLSVCPKKSDAFAPFLTSLLSS